MTSAASRSRPLWMPIVGLLLLNLLVLAGGGVATVWMKERTARLAARTASVEQQLAVVDRRLQDVDTRLAALLTPPRLQALVAEHGLPLAPPRRDQIVFLEPVRFPAAFSDRMPPLFSQVTADGGGGPVR